MKLKPEMQRFLDKKKYPGMQDKLGWYYNKFIARVKAKNRVELYSQKITRKIRRKFPGFAKLYRFRNDLSHGVINPSATSLTETMKLRKQAKEIVDEFFRIASKNGYKISRDMTYYEAINSL